MPPHSTLECSRGYAVDLTDRGCAQRPAFMCDATVITNVLGARSMVDLRCCGPAGTSSRPRRAVAPRAMETIYRNRCHERCHATRNQRGLASVLPGQMGCPRQDSNLRHTV